MARTVGVLAVEHIAVGLVEDGRLAGPVHRYPDDGVAVGGGLPSMPAEQVAQTIRRLVDEVRGSHAVEAIGIGFPGIIREGVVEDSPNLPQMKGYGLAQAVGGDPAPAARVLVLNDADAVAAGLAATRGAGNGLTRVWTLGSGVGFGRHPRAAGVGEGGHLVVSLDPKENLCGCGGQGHLEGIVGHRSMRLRFLDLEPDEVFEAAHGGDARCAAFVRTWHRALAAATASSIHLDGPGRFYLSGPNARFVDTSALATIVQEMVRMSPLQGSAFEIIDTGDEIAIVGAAVSALE